MYKFRTLLLIVLLGCCNLTLQAQEFSKEQLKRWKQHPDWISMMDDSTANYFTVVTAFNTFWEHHEMPVEEDQILRGSRDEKETRGFLRKLFKGSEKKEREMRHRYAFAVKKYRHWLIMVEPYVQPDGTILSKTQQLELWKMQRTAN